MHAARRRAVRACVRCSISARALCAVVRPVRLCVLVFPVYIGTQPQHRVRYITYGRVHALLMCVCSSTPGVHSAKFNKTISYSCI